MSESQPKICPRCEGEKLVYVEYTKAFRRQHASKIVKCPQCGGNGFIHPDSDILSEDQFYDMAKRAKSQ